MDMPSRAQPGKPLSTGARLAAFAADQLRLAESHLKREDGERHEGVHQARKCMRRTRAALELGAGSLDLRAARIGNALKGICRGLSWLRDRQAIVEAIQRLEGQADGDIHETLREARRVALEGRDLAMARALARDPTFRSRVDRLANLRERLSRLNLQDIDEDDVNNAMKRNERRLARARRRAERHPEQDERWHIYRRRLRRFRQLISIVSECALGVRHEQGSLADQAKLLGDAQDDALILRFCAGRSPFPPRQRAVLRGLARARLNAVRRG